MGDSRFSLGTRAEVGEAWVTGHIDALADAAAAHGVSDLLILSRNAWVGTAQRGASLWSGDVQSTFAVLAQQVAAVQQAGMSGLPLMTSDTGGYYNGDPSNAQFQELIVRWFQFSALTPLMRVHGHRAGGPPIDPVCGLTNGDNVGGRAWVRGV